MEEIEHVSRRVQTSECRIPFSKFEKYKAFFLRQGYNRDYQLEDAENFVQCHRLNVSHLRRPKRMVQFSTKSYRIKGLPNRQISLKVLGAPTRGDTDSNVKSKKNLNFTVSIESVINKGTWENKTWGTLRVGHWFKDFG